MPFHMCAFGGKALITPPTHTAILMWKRGKAAYPLVQGLSVLGVHHNAVDAVQANLPLILQLSPLFTPEVKEKLHILTSASSHMTVVMFPD